MKKQSPSTSRRASVTSAALAPTSSTPCAAANASAAAPHWLSATRAHAHHDAARLDALLRASGFKPEGGAPLFRWVKCDDAHGTFMALAQRGVLARAFESQPHALRFGVPADEETWRLLAGRLEGLAV